SRPRCRCRQRPIGQAPELLTPKPTGKSILRRTRRVSEAVRKVADRRSARKTGVLVNQPDLAVWLTHRAGSERRDSVTLEAVDRPRSRGHEPLCLEIRKRSGPAVRSGASCRRDGRTRGRQRAIPDTFRGGSAASGTCGRLRWYQV